MKTIAKNIGGEGILTAFVLILIIAAGSLFAVNLLKLASHVDNEISSSVARR